MTERENTNEKKNTKKHSIGTNQTGKFIQSISLQFKKEKKKKKEEGSSNGESDVCSFSLCHCVVIAHTVWKWNA